MSSSTRKDSTLVWLSVLLITCTIGALLSCVFVLPAVDHAGIQVQTRPSVLPAEGTCLSQGAGKSGALFSRSGAAPAEPVHVKILAVNDFHGQLTAGQTLNKEPVGSAPVLAAYLKSAMAVSGPSHTIIAMPGDVVGASPPESGLLLDEPSMLFFNGFANSCCRGAQSETPSCNMVATLGNHEFDKGTGELMRKLYGGDGTTTITHLVDPYPGTRSSYISANVVWKSNGTLVLPPYVIREVDGIPIAFIGADTIKTTELQIPANTEDVAFLDEAASINTYVTLVRKNGIHAIVVLLHEGGKQDPYTGPTQTGGNITGRVADIVANLDGDVDVVLSAHTHAFTNTYLENSGKNPVLVTQAYMYSKGYADVDLTMDPVTGDIVSKTAQIVPVYADQPPGTTPDPETSAFLAADKAVVAPVVSRVVAVAAADITREQDAGGESALGDLVADGQRAAMGSDVAFVTSGSLRADLLKGNVTWGDLYSVQPFSAPVLSMTLNGDQIKRVLEQQWQTPLPPHNLMISGLAYTYDASKPPGSRVVDVKVHGVPLNRNATHTAAMVDFLASGGDGYTTFTGGKNVTYGPFDIDALTSYVGMLPQPLNVTVDGRIQKVG